MSNCMFCGVLVMDDNPRPYICYDCDELQRQNETVDDIPGMEEDI